jgi:hypothetical protein
MATGDIGRLEIMTNSAHSLARRLPYTVECACGEKITTETMEDAYCKCGILHRFRSRVP